MDSYRRSGLRQRRLLWPQSCGLALEAAARDKLMLYLLLLLPPTRPPRLSALGQENETENILIITFGVALRGFHASPRGQRESRRGSYGQF